MTRANIVVPVDLTNPGQFFACCGLLEIADRLWGGAAGWFESGTFSLITDNRSGSLAELLAEVRNISFDVEGSAVGENEDDDEDGPDRVNSILLSHSQQHVLHLDWWGDKSLKPWAGSMKERVILRAMLTAIVADNPDPFNDLHVVHYHPQLVGTKGKPKKAQKKEPFYFDSRRGNKSRPLDGGFSPDTHKMETECCPALEALCFIGLQRARPAATGVTNQSRYTAWRKLSDSDPGLCPSIVGAVSCGRVRLPGSTEYVFRNYFRTDQNKHKAFSVAHIERT